MNIKHCFIPFKWGLRLNLFYHGFFLDFNGFGKRKYIFYSRFNKKKKNSFYFFGFYFEFF